MGDTHDPGNELPLLRVSALLDRRNRFDERLLEEVVCKISVLDGKVNVRKHFVLSLSLTLAGN